MTDFTGGELVARVLKQAGVGHVFTLCGGHVLPIYDGCVKDGIVVIDVRHEQAAAHAADAYARLTRHVGVAIVTAGPGVTDAVTGVANAHAARSPLLLIGGAAPLGLRGRGALQEVEQVALLRPVTKGAWSVAETRQIPEVLTTAIRVALSGRPGPVFVEIPVDVLLTTVEDRLAPIPTDYVHRTPLAGDPAAVERLAALLAGAERPVIVAGSGVYWDDAAAPLAALVGAAGVPVFMNGAGRGSLPADHPLAFAQARGFALGHADVVLVLGTPLDFRLGYGRPPTFAEGGPADRRRRRLRPQRHGDGDGREIRPADHLHHRQRRRLGPDPQPPAVLLRRGARRRDVAADDALRPDGRSARRPRYVGSRAQRHRPRARARPEIRRRLVHQRSPRSRRLPPHRSSVHGHLMNHASRRPLR